MKSMTQRTRHICLALLFIAGIHSSFAGYNIFDKTKPGAKSATKDSGPKPEIHLEFEQILGGKTPDSGNQKASVEVVGTKLTNGKIGQALEFGSESDKLTIDLDLNTVAPDAYSIAVWVKPDNQKNYGLLFNSGASKGVSLRMMGMRADFNAAFEWHLLGPDTTPLPNLEWSHIVATYDGAEARLYLNGKLVGEKSIGYKISYGKQIFIGQVTENQTADSGGKEEKAGQFFTGAMDDLRFYSQVLTAEEVAALAQAK